jgi:hypothetical protein
MVGALSVGDVRSGGLMEGRTFFNHAGSVEGSSGAGVFAAGKSVSGGAGKVSNALDGGSGEGLAVGGFFGTSNSRLGAGATAA